ncbi:MAG TPA: DUF2934 domain-containing protein [Verrucomicrobiae bacterium]|nr:DUF2934 domain-containing protein [Verrucomicrobiae bacterium]
MKSKSTQKNKVNEAQDSAVVRKQIETRAYEIWGASGGAHGDDVKHWLQAENEVLSDHKKGLKS